RVERASVENVEDERGEPDQVLVLETSTPVAEAEMEQHVHAWLLPRFDPARPEEPKEGRPHDWSAAELVDGALRTPAHALPLDPIAGEREYRTLHSFRYHARHGSWIYVEVTRGALSFGGYRLAETFATTLQIPPLPRALKILGAGALVSMSG